MRPDLAFSPSSGSPVAAGPLSITWTPPEEFVESLTIIAGTSPGDSDIGTYVVLAGESIDFEVPAEARRVYVTAVLELDTPAWFAYSLAYSVLGSGLPAETVVRRLLGTYFLEAWLGAGLDERRFCPAAVPGEVSFDAEDPDDVAPWSPAEVRDEVGYVLLRFREVDRFDDGLTAGAAPVDGAVRIVSGEYTLWNLEFEFRVPSKAADAVGTIEIRRSEVEDLFRGLAISPEGSSVVSIRNLTRYPTRRREGGDDGTWRRAWLDVKVRSRVRRPHAGVQEVALP